MNNRDTKLSAAMAEVRQIAGEGLVMDESAILSSESKATTTSVTILQSAGGFMGSLAFLALMFALDIYEYPYLVMGLGIFFTVGSLIQSHLLKKPLPDTIGIFLFIIGCFLTMMGAAKFDWNTNLIISLMTAISVVSLSATKNRMIAFAASLFFIGSLIAFTAENRWDNGIHAIVNVSMLLSFLFFLKEPQLLHLRSRFSEIGSSIGTAGALAGLAMYQYISFSHFLNFDQQFVWTSSLASWMIVLMIIHTLSQKQLKTTIVAGLLLAAPSYFAPAIIGALAVILIGFAYRKKLLLVLGVISFIQFNSQFYYDLKFTLLQKSIMMMATGILFLIAYYLLKKTTSKNEIPSHQ